MKRFLFVFLFLGLLLITFLGFSWFKSFDEKVESFSIASGRIPVSLTLFGRSSDTISARLSLFNTAGDALASLERSWSGWDLSLDCIVIGTKKGWLVFPYSLYSDESSLHGGSKLFRLYDSSGFPVLWDKKHLSGKQIKFLKQLFFIVKTERWMPSFLGSLHHEQVTIRSFETGLEYGLYISNEGKLLFKGY